MAPPAPAIYFYHTATGALEFKTRVGDPLRTFASAISATGVVTALHNEPVEAGFWTEAAEWTDLAAPYLVGCGSDYAGAWDVSANGRSTVGLVWNGCAAEAFRWDAPGSGILTPLQRLGASFPGSTNPPGNRATVISDDGAVAAGWAQTNLVDRWPAIWNPDGTGFLLPGGTFPADAPGEVLAISANGKTLAGVWNQEGFCWTVGTGVVNLGQLPGNGAFTGGIDPQRDRGGRQADLRYRRFPLLRRAAPLRVDVRRRDAAAGFAGDQPRCHHPRGLPPDQHPGRFHRRLGRAGDRLRPEILPGDVRAHAPRPGLRPVTGAPMTIPSMMVAPMAVRLSRALLSCIAVLSLVSCGGDGGLQPGEPAEIVVSDSVFTFTAVGQNHLFTASVTDIRGRPVDMTLSWSTSDPAVLKLNGDGLATAARAGTATVTVAAGSVTAVATVTISQVAAHIYAVGGGGQGGQPSQALPFPMVVQITDVLNHPAPGVLVTFATTDAGAAVSPATATTDFFGQAATTLTLGPALGP